jgi:hypothetical protein
MIVTGSPRIGAVAVTAEQHADGVRPTAQRSSVSGEVRAEGLDAAGRPRIVVIGRLDLVAGSRLRAACGSVLNGSAVGLALDLTLLSGVTGEGTAALAHCLAAGRQLAGGVEISVANSVGRRVLLDTLAGC